MWEGSFLRTELGTVSTVRRRVVGTWRMSWFSWDELVGEVEKGRDVRRYFKSFGGSHAYASAWNLPGRDAGQLNALFCGPS